MFKNLVLKFHIVAVAVNARRSAGQRLRSRVEMQRRMPGSSSQVSRSGAAGESLPRLHTLELVQIIFIFSMHGNNADNLNRNFFTFKF